MLTCCIYITCSPCEIEPIPVYCTVAVKCHNNVLWWKCKRIRNMNARYSITLHLRIKFVVELNTFIDMFSNELSTYVQCILSQIKWWIECKLYVIPIYNTNVPCALQIWWVWSRVIPWRDCPTHAMHIVTAFVLIWNVLIILFWFWLFYFYC